MTHKLQIFFKQYSELKASSKPTECNNNREIPNKIILEDNLEELICQVGVAKLKATGCVFSSQLK